MNMLIIPDQRRDEKMTFGPDHVAALPSGREEGTQCLPDLPSWDVGFNCGIEQNPPFLVHGLVMLSYVHVVVLHISRSFSSCKTETADPLNDNRHPLFNPAPGNHCSFYFYEFDYFK